MSATSLNLNFNVEMKERVQHLAASRRQTTHTIMREAIAEYVSREVKRQSFLQDALVAWQAYQKTGLHLSWEEADAWLEKMEVDEVDQESLDPRMSRLRWTQAALQDVKRLHDGLPLHRLDMAQRAVKAVRQRAQALAVDPAIGRPVEEPLPGLKELLVDFGLSAYIALYREDGDQIVMLAVRHGREAGY